MFFSSRQSLYQVISAAFCVIVVISNIISAKMVRLPLFEAFAIPAGLITYPLTFLLSDLATELFGEKKAKSMIYTAFALNVLSFGIIYVALQLPAISEQEQTAFQAVLGLSGLRTFSSLVSFVSAQVVDVQLYALIKRWTGPHHLWLRNNGSTLTSQLVDTLMIDIIYLYWGLEMSFEQVLPIMCFSYCYKAFFSMFNTPIFYLLVNITKALWEPKMEALNT
ncbi:MAG: queuosine precursor transporter [Parachlamydiaceae bacterium]